MPPGQHHAVYTPVAGFSRGGHYYNLDTMHLTELSRFVDTIQGKVITNNVRYGTLETLCRMVISLTIIPKSRSESPSHFANCLLRNPLELYKHSLIALCGMVTYHEHYVSQGTTAQKSSTLDKATEIATTVLVHFGLINGLKQYEAFLVQTEMLDRGEEVYIHGLLHSLAMLSIV